MLKLDLCGETRFLPDNAALYEAIAEKCGRDVLDHLGKLIDMREVHEYCDGECDAGMSHAEYYRMIAQEAMELLDEALAEPRMERKRVQAVRDHIWKNL